MTRLQIERAANVKLVRGWILDGAGPARFGYAVQHPCRQQYVGATLREVAAKLGVLSAPLCEKCESFEHHTEECDDLHAPAEEYESVESELGLRGVWS